MTEHNEGLPQLELPLEGVAPEISETEVPSALRNVDPEKLKALREKLRKFTVGKGQTVSGSETPVDDRQPTQTPVASDQHIPTGKDVDWSEYDLDFSVRHLYEQALLRQTKDGVKWVVMLDEFHSTSRAARQYGKQVNAPGSTDGKNTEPLNLGEYLTQTVNSPEGWRIAAVLPGVAGEVTVLMQRKVPYILPDPKALVKENEHEVEVPSDEELSRTEAAAIEFAADVNLPVPDLEEEVDEQDKVRFTDEGNPIFAIKERLPEQLVGLTARIALELNPGDPAPAGEQPEAVEIEGRLRAAGIENIRTKLPNLLDGPDFGTV